MYPAHKDLEAFQVWHDTERQLRTAGRLRAHLPLPAARPSVGARLMAHLGRMLVALGTQLQRYDTAHRPM